MPFPIYETGSLVRVTGDSADASVQWAIDHLLGVGGAADVRIDLRREQGGEQFAFERPDGDTIVVAGPNAGLVHGILELADRARHGSPAALRRVEPERHTPATPVRSISRVFACEIEDKPWFYDRDFWTEYLTELATHRINRLQLAFGMQYNYPHHPATDNYFCFAYPFLLDVPGYDVRAGDLTSEERAKNLRTLQFICTECERRGIHFQLGLWNHAYDQGPGSEPTYPISGLTPQNHAEYCATALGVLLGECPSIKGLTVRVHYEGGVPEPGHDFWRTVMAGTKSAGRSIEIDMHAKGVDDGLIEVARSSGHRVTLSAKYWAEHQGLPYHQTTIRDRERATADPGTGLMSLTAHQRRFTRYGYGDFLREHRDHDLIFRIWPGTQRVLLWGDPVLAAGYGRLGTIGGARGVELCEPLTFSGRKGTGNAHGRDPYGDPALRLNGREWRKHRYTYRLWGRLLYEPDADPEQWRRFLRTEFGDAAMALERSLAAASRVLPLVTVVHGLGASNNGYWPEMYVNMPIAGGPNAEQYRGDTADPPTFGAVSPFDPSMFYTVDAYARDLLAGRHDGRYGPDDVARWLENLAHEARSRLAEATRQAGDAQAPEFRRYAVDIAAQASLAEFFAAKFRAGLAYALHRQGKDDAQLAAAIAHYERARSAWADVAATTSVYRPLAFGHQFSEYGHWNDRLADIDADLTDLRSRLCGTPEPAPEPPHRGAAPPVRHEPQACFTPGADVTIRMSCTDVADVTLHYRHLNQGEDFRTAAMDRTEDGWRATIPGSYTRSDFPLVYYFVVRRAPDQAWISPGFRDSLADQPYHVLRQG